MLTLIRVYGDCHLFIDNTTYKTHEATTEQVFRILNGNKNTLNGVKLNPKYNGRSNSKLTYQFEGIFYILNKIGDIGYIICDMEGKVSKVDNLTCIVYIRLGLLNNATLAKGSVRVKCNYGKVGVKQSGINEEGLTVNSSRYTGKVIDWSGVIKEYTTICDNFKIENGKLINIRGYYGRTQSERENFALCRNVVNGGVRYKVHNNVYANQSTIPLEVIYENYRDYDNVSVDGDIIRVSALDGVYEYDMKLIYAEYKTKRVQSKTALKASLIGVDHNESLDEQYRLHRLTSKGENLSIPVSTKHIMARSIVIDEENTGLFFPESVETCNINCFDKDGSVHYNIEKVGIAVTGEARLQILKVFINRSWVLDKNAVIDFRGGITPYEYGYFITSNLVTQHNCSINGINKEQMTDEFIESVVNSIINVTFDNFNIIQRPIEPEIIEEYGRVMDIRSSKKYEKLKKELKLFKEVYLRELAPYATNMLNEKVGKFIGKVEYTIQMRDIELTQTIRQLNKI